MSGLTPPHPDAQDDFLANGPLTPGSESLAVPPEKVRSRSSDQDARRQRSVTMKKPAPPSLQLPPRSPQQVFFLDVPTGDTVKDDKEIERLRQELSERDAELAQAAYMGNELVKLVKNLREEISARDAEIANHANEIEQVGERSFARVKELEMELKTYRHYEFMYEERGLEIEKLRNAARYLRHSRAKTSVFFVQDKSALRSGTLKTVQRSLQMVENPALRRAWWRWVSWTHNVFRSRMQSMANNFVEGVCEPQSLSTLESNEPSTPFLNTQIFKIVSMTEVDKPATPFLHLQIFKNVSMREYNNNCRVAEVQTTGLESERGTSQQVNEDATALTELVANKTTTILQLETTVYQKNQELKAAYALAERHRAFFEQHEHYINDLQQQVRSVRSQNKHLLHENELLNRRYRDVQGSYSSLREDASRWQREATRLQSSPVRETYLGTYQQRSPTQMTDLGRSDSLRPTLRPQGALDHNHRSNSLFRGT